MMRLDRLWSASTQEALGHLFDWILIGFLLYVLRVISWGSTLGKVFCIFYGAILLLCVYLLLRSLVHSDSGGKGR